MHAEQDDLLEDFGRLSARLPGKLVVAVARGPGEDPRVLGDDRAFHAWSTIKVPVLAAVLSLVHPEALTPEQHTLAQRAITESDNPSILELFVLLEGLAGGSAEAAAVIERLFRRSGDRRTRIALLPPPPGAITPFGQTGWSAAESVRFFAALAEGRLLTGPATRYVFELMSRIIAEQRWGLGTLDLPAAFKGGWGPEPDGTCLVRQSGVLCTGPIAVSMIAEPPPGEDSFPIGVGVISEAAAWLAGRLEGRFLDIPQRG